MSVCPAIIIAQTLIPMSLLNPNPNSPTQHMGPDESDPLRAVYKLGHSLNLGPAGSRRWRRYLTLCSSVGVRGKGYRVI